MKLYIFYIHVNYQERPIITQDTYNLMQTIYILEEIKEPIIDIVRYNKQTHKAESLSVKEIKELYAS